MDNVQADVVEQDETYIVTICIDDEECGEINCGANQELAEALADRINGDQ